MNKIILGTAQFGMDYGIRNKMGMVGKEEVFKVLDSAINSGVDTLDTAFAYGESEKTIGEFLKKSGKKLNIITKLPKCRYRDVRSIFDDSLVNFNSSSVEGYLIHNFTHYEADKNIWNQLERLKSEGKIENIGFSLYFPHELEAIFDDKLAIDMIQIPFNIFDRRFQEYLPELKNRGIVVHVRSIFLQGLFFEAPEKLHSYFNPIRQRIIDLNDLSAKTGVPLFALCLNFVLVNNLIDGTVIGVDGLEHFTQLLTSSRFSAMTNKVMAELNNMRLDDENIILPINWKLN